MSDKRTFINKCMDILVDGGWSAWEEWSSCSFSCGLGTQMRTRTCSNPFPANMGDNCTGNNAHSRNCFLRQCPGTYILRHRFHFIQKYLFFFRFNHLFFFVFNKICCSHHLATFNYFALKEVSRFELLCA